MKHKKTLVAILLIAVLIFSLTTFIACNNDNDENAPSELETQINNFIAYGANNYAFYSIAAFYNKSNSEYFGDGIQWYIESEFSNNNGTDATAVYLYEYDTDENAKAAASSIFDSQNEPTIKRDGKTIIQTTVLGIYDAIKASSLSSSITTSTVYEYSIKTLRSKIYSSTNLLYTYACYNNYSNEYDSNMVGALFQLQSEPLNGNCSEDYFCSTMYGFGDIEDEIGIEYTEDSYSKVENNIYYGYTKIKPGFRYELTDDDNGYKITGYYYNTTNGTVTIPSEYNGKPITEIGEGGLNYLPKDIKKIVIPNSVIEIGRDAFKECTGLESIVIPISVTKIESTVFSGNDTLQKIYCEVQSKPVGWNDYWNSGCNAEVVWGYNG